MADPQLISWSGGYAAPLPALAPHGPEVTVGASSARPRCPILDMPGRAFLGWLGHQWFPIVTVVGLGFHAAYTAGSIKREFEALETRLSRVEETTRHVPEIGWRVTNAESSRLELRSDIAKLSDKQDIMDGKLNRIIGGLALDRKVAVTP